MKHCWLLILVACSTPAARPDPVRLPADAQATIKVYDLSVDGKAGTDSVWQWRGGNGEETALSRSRVGRWSREAWITRTESGRFARGKSSESSGRNSCSQAWNEEGGKISMLLSTNNSGKGSSTILEVEDRYYLDVPLVTAVEWSIANAVPFADATNAIVSPGCAGGSAGMYPSIFRLSGRDEILFTRWRLKDETGEGADSLWWDRKTASVTRAVLIRRGETAGHTWIWSIRR